jgi:hypothetical protein
MNRSAHEHASGELLLKEHIVVAVVIITMASRGVRGSAGSQNAVDPTRLEGAGRVSAVSFHSF